MKSILLASKPSNNNQLSVGAQSRKNESLSIASHQHYLHLNNTATTESVAETIDKEHYNKLFSNSKKQVIRNRCVKSSDVDKVKRVSSDACDGKITPNEHSGDQRLLIKLTTSDSGSELENRPLIVDHGKSSLINLRKKNGTTLIFQKKQSNAHKHPNANEYQELESFKKRRSLQQWPNTGFSNQPDSNNANRHSWYDSDYYPRAIEEEFDEVDVSSRLSCCCLLCVQWR